MRSFTEIALSHALLGVARFAERRLQGDVKSERSRVLQATALTRCLRAMEGSPVRQRHGVSLLETPDSLRRKQLCIDPAEFQALIHGDEFRPEHFSREGVLSFAISSGTSSTSAKLFPITCEYVRALERMQKLYFMHRLALAGNPHLSLGNAFMITGLDMKTMHAGKPVNPISRILYDLFKNPPLSLTRICHVSTFFDEVSLDLLPNARLEDMRDVRMHSLFGMPPFVLMIFERLRERFGISSLRDIWPHLAFYGHSGFNVAPYRDRLLRILGDGVFFFDGYAASEAIMGLQYKADAPDLVFLPHDTFYEFLCLRSGDRLHLHELREGDSYELLLTTPGGLLAYPIGDVVTVTGTDPVRFLVSGRLEETLRLTSEQVDATQIASALQHACQSEGLEQGSFIVAPRQKKMGYEVFVELSTIHTNGSLFAQSSDGHLEVTLTRIAEHFDTHLRDINNVYGMMRTSALLAEPCIVPLRVGSLDSVMLEGKRLGQAKFRRLYSNRAEVESRVARFERLDRI